MEIKNLKNIVFQIIHLPVSLYETNLSWDKLLIQTGYFDIDSELITIDLIKKNLNSKNEILDGWIYFSENQKSENATFIWFNNDNKNKYEIKKYSSKHKEYIVLENFPNKESCCAYFIKHQIEKSKQLYYEKIKHEKKRFFGCFFLNNRKEVWRMRYEEKQYYSSFYPFVKIEISFNSIKIKTVTDKLIFSIQKCQDSSIIILKNSIKFIIGNKTNSTYNFGNYYNYFNSNKIISFLKKIKWI